MSGAAEARPPGGSGGGDIGTGSGAGSSRLQARNAGLALACQVLGAIFTTGLTIFLVRKLGPDDYGVFALATGIGAVAILLSDLGISQATARFLAENRDRPDARRHFIRAALRLKLIAALAVSGLLALLANPIASAYGIDELTPALQIIAVALFGQSMMFLSFAYFEAMARNEGALLVVLVESFAETTFSIAFVLLGAGVTGAVAGRATGYVVAGALSVLLVVRAVGLRAGPLESRPEGHARAIIGYALSLSVIDGVMTLFARLDVLLIGAYLGAGAAGIFEAPLRLTTTLQYVGSAMASGFAPFLTGVGDGPARTHIFEVGLRWLIVFQCFATAFTVVWAGPITALTLGAGYSESAEVLRALGPYVFLSGLAALLTIGVNYVGAARSRVPIAVVSVLINLVVDIVLIPRIGIVAGAIGSGLAMMVYVPGHIWILRDRIELPLRSPAVTFLRAALAAGAMTVPMFLAGTGSLSVTEWIWGTAGAVAVFCVVLFAIGEVSKDDLRWIRGWVSRRVDARHV